MGITATLKINKNHLTYNQAYPFCKVLIGVSSISVATTMITLYFEQITTNMVGILRNIWMFRIEIKHKSRCSTKIFYYTCNLLQVLFMIFLLKSFTSNVFFEILYWYCKPFCFEHFKNGGSSISIIIVSPYRTLFAQCDEINL